MGLDEVVVLLEAIQCNASGETALIAGEVVNSRGTLVRSWTALYILSFWNAGCRNDSDSKEKVRAQSGHTVSSTGSRVPESPTISR